jgi:hypothetical protein
MRNELVFECQRKRPGFDLAFDPEQLGYLLLADVIEPDLHGKFVSDFLAEVVILNDDHTILDGKILTSARIVALFHAHSFDRADTFGLADGFDFNKPQDKSLYPAP